MKCKKFTRKKDSRKAISAYLERKIFNNFNLGVNYDGISGRQ